MSRILKTTTTPTTIMVPSQAQRRSQSSQLPMESSLKKNQATTTQILASAKPSRPKPKLREAEAEATAAKKKKINGIPKWLPANASQCYSSNDQLWTFLSSTTRNHQS
jgi:hypothetical protein